jgi:hypothetical protein
LFGRSRLDVKDAVLLNRFGFFSEVVVGGAAGGQGQDGCNADEMLHEISL